MKAELGLRKMAIEFAIRTYCFGTSTDDVVKRAENFLMFLKGGNVKARTKKMKKNKKRGLSEQASLS
jgi:hypothetical protein